MGPETLTQVLCQLQDMTKCQSHPELLVGLDISDDAAVYKISDQIAIIHTLDFFTPIVDDPYDFGAIAAANAMSDVYAMGGEVILALNICGFPNDLAKKSITEILRGGAHKILEANGILAGGHTIADKEPKYGLSVLGKVEPGRVLTKAGAKEGDLLVLTKPLGTSVITTALKRGEVDCHHLGEAVDSMKTLNKYSAGLLNEVAVSACTDVTGYGLIGHGIEMADKSEVRIKFFMQNIPLLNGASDYASRRFFPGGSKNNKIFYEKKVQFCPDMTDEEKMLLFSPETSGGLLAAVSVNDIETLKDQFHQANLPLWIVGEVFPGNGIEVARH